MAFPQFRDGNVEIYFSKTDEKYILHSHILALHSSWFKSTLSAQWNQGNEPVTIDGKHHWEYELLFDTEKPGGTLARKGNTSSSAGKDFIGGSQQQLPEGTSTTEIELHANRVKCIKAHQNMFRTLYHIAPTLKHGSFEDAISSITELAKVADFYGSEQVIKTYVDNHLLFFRAEVEEQCAKEPLKMLTLAMLVKSEWILMEAATVLIGHDIHVFQAALPKLDDLGLAELMKAKRVEFISKLKDAELALFKLQPPPTQAQWERGLAMNYFRQWLANQLSQDQGSALNTNYARVYLAIDCSNYLKNKDGAHQASLAAFINTTLSWNPDAQPELRARITAELYEIFAAASMAIRPITAEKTRRRHNNPFIHRDLTCIGIKDDELPWAKG